MRLFRYLPLLLSLLAPAALADQLYEVDLILFRQGSEPILASQPAPDDWAAGARAPAAEDSRSTSLNSEAAKLSPGKGYEVLLHQAWQQNLGRTPSKVALSSGGETFGHHPVEGTLSLKLVRFVDLDVDFWVNRLDADGLLSASERLKQSIRLKNGELTYLDHGSLGILVRVNPL